MPKDKMVLGIGTYGRCWTLDDISDHGMLAPAHAPGPAGPYIRIPGTLGYNEVRLIHKPQVFDYFGFYLCLVRIFDANL